MDTNESKIESGINLRFCALVLLQLAGYAVLRMLGVLPSPMPGEEGWTTQAIGMLAAMLMVALALLAGARAVAVSSHSLKRAKKMSSLAFMAMGAALVCHGFATA